MERLRSGCVFGLGNPLLDMLTYVDAGLCKRYGLKLDDAILANPEHMPLYEELVEKYDVEYAAGGATLNTIRMIQWLVESPHVCTYVGCIGDDKAAEILKRECDRSHLRTMFQYSTKNTATGKCAVLLQNHHRSMVTYLGACKELTLEHVVHNETWACVEEAQMYYIAVSHVSSELNVMLIQGFAINSCFDAILQIADHAQSEGKLLSFNLSAPFLPLFYTKEVDTVLPYVDILFANQAEAEAYGAKHELENKSLAEIAVHLANIPRIASTKRKRIVLLTQADNPVILGIEGEDPIELPVPKLAPKDIVDTNGAGDAFAAGFLADYVVTLSVKSAVKAALKAAKYVIQRSGFTLGCRDKY